MGLWTTPLLFGLPDNPPPSYNTLSLRREQQLPDRRRERLQNIHDQEHTFVSIHSLQNANEESIIETSEAEDLQFWANYQSWTFCANCSKLDPRKLLPPFRNRAATPLFTACKCSRGTYQVPTTDDVPLVVHQLTIEEYGDYRQMFNGYRQRTGPFCVSWSSTLVRERK